MEMAIEYLFEKSSFMRFGKYENKVCVNLQKIHLRNEFKKIQKSETTREKIRNEELQIQTVRHDHGPMR